MVQANIHEIFTPDEIARFEAEGHWPPPKGLTFVKESTPSPGAVKDFARLLAGFLPPERAAIVTEIFQLDQ